MNLDDLDDPIAAQIATALVLAAWNKHADLPDGKRLDLIGASLAELTDLAAGLRAAAASVAAGSSAEAVEARAAAKAAAAERERRRFAEGGRAVEQRITKGAAVERLARERKVLEKTERAFAALERDRLAPDSEVLIAQGALLMARERVRAAEAALADVERADRR
jgi:hypothetical protein